MQEAPHTETTPTPPDDAASSGAEAVPPGGGGDSSSTPERREAWYPVSVADDDLIARRFPESAASLFRIWAVLVREAGFRRSPTFTLADSIIADRAKLSRRRVCYAKAQLRELGLATSESKRGKRDRRNPPTRWAIKPTVLFVDKSRASTAHDTPHATIAHDTPCATDGGGSVAQTLHPPSGGWRKKESGANIARPTTQQTSSPSPSPPPGSAGGLRPAAPGGDQAPWKTWER